MNFEYLHEVEHVDLLLDTPREIYELLPVFEKLGFTVHEDIVSLDRTGSVPPWQHSSVVEVELQFCGNEVFDFDGSWDQMRLKYAFATLPFDCSHVFIEAVFTLSKYLETSVKFQGCEIESSKLVAKFAEARAEVVSRTGEDVGTDNLARIIVNSYPRS